MISDGGDGVEHEEVVKTEDWDYQEAQSSSRDYGSGYKVRVLPEKKNVKFCISSSFFFKLLL